MPFEFRDADDDQASAPGKGMLAGALIAIVGLAVIAAVAVFAIVFVVNNVASDTLSEIDADNLCDDSQNVIPPGESDPEHDAAETTHDDFHDEYLAHLGPDDGWWGSGIIHTGDYFAIGVFVDDPAAFTDLPEEYRGVPVAVCQEEPAVPLEE